MLIEIEVGGRVRPVRLERAGGGPHRYRVTVGERSRLIDVVRPCPTRLSLLVAEDALGREPVHSYEAGLFAVGDSQIEVHLRGAVVRTAVNGPRRTAARSGVGAAATGPIRVSAPMPGRVVRVLAAVGEAVREGQALVVVEAMKMENAVVAPAAGQIRELSVAEGMSVEGGRVLAVIEPPAREDQGG